MKLTIKYLLSCAVPTGTALKMGMAPLFGPCEESEADLLLSAAATLRRDIAIEWLPVSTPRYGGGGWPLELWRVMPPKITGEEHCAPNSLTPLKSRETAHPTAKPPAPGQPGSRRRRLPLSRPG